MSPGIIKTGGSLQQLQILSRNATLLGYGRSSQELESKEFRTGNWIIHFYALFILNLYWIMRVSVLTQEVLKRPSFSWRLILCRNVPFLFVDLCCCV